MAKSRNYRSSGRTGGTQSGARSNAQKPDEDTLTQADTIVTPEVSVSPDVSDEGTDSLAVTDDTTTPAESDDTIAPTDAEAQIDNPEADPVVSDPAETPESVEAAPHEGADVASAEADDTLSDAADKDTALLMDDMSGPEPVTTATPAPQVIKETTVERKGGFVPMLLGGVVAAALGYVAGTYPDLPFSGPPEVVEDPFVTETKATLRAQDERLTGLDAKAEANASAVAGIDLTPLAGSISGLEGQLAEAQTAVDALQTSLSGVTDQLGALDGRVTTIEKQPLVDAVSPETIAAYERELERLQGEVTAQQAAIAAAAAEQQAAMAAAQAEQQAAMAAAQAEQQAVMDAARAQIEAMADRALESEQTAETRAKLAANRSALAALTTRARDGQPYAESLAVLTANGVSIPDALAQGAEEGLPTASTLLSEYPNAARNALRVARSIPAEGAEAGGLGSFFQSQLGARSVTPRDGDDPDAVLSRAEAALRGGDLNTVLTELTALPDAAQTELSDWVAMAQLRRDALAAAASLSQELNQE